MEDHLVSYFFPKGFRLMVVDEDVRSLGLAEATLSNCNYKVTPCENPKLALSILRKKTSEFDLLLADVQMSKMNVFKLLEVVYGKLSIPVGLMSIDKRNEITVKAMLKGACFFLEKPLNSYLVRAIWRCVIWKIFPLEKEIKNKGVAEGKGKTCQRFMDKEFKNKNSSKGNDDFTKSKKSRLIWTPRLEQKFQNAINQLGLDGATATRVTKLMNIKGVERQHVASHLQKYHIRLNRELREMDIDNSMTIPITNYHLLEEQGPEYMQLSNEPDLDLAMFISQLGPLPSQTLPTGVSPYPISTSEHAQAYLSDLPPNRNIGSGPCQGDLSTMEPSTKSLFGIWDNFSNTQAGIAPFEGPSQPLQFEDRIENYFDGPIDTGFVDDTSNNIPLAHNLWQENNIFTPEFTAPDYMITDDGLASSGAHQFQSLSHGQQHMAIDGVGSSSKNAEEDDYYQLLDKFLAGLEQDSQKTDEAPPTN